MTESSHLREGESDIRQRTIGLASIVALGAIYAITASWGLEGQTRDSLATALPAWNLVENASLDLTEFSHLDAWIAESQTGYFTNRTPGLIGTTALGYLLAAPWVEGFVFWPGTMVAVSASVGAVAILATLARRLASVPWITGVFVIGLGTAIWAVAADQIWPHGPATLLVATAALMLDSDRPVAAGIALGAAILVRPPVAILAATVGIGLAISKRDWRPILQIGVPSGIGAVAFLAYTSWMFGSWGPLALYEGGLQTGRPQSVGEWVGNVVNALVLPQHGVFIWSAWLAVGVFALTRTRIRLPAWVVPSLWAGISYVAVHVAINRVSGGLTYNYRYPIEPLALVAPVLLSALWMLRDKREIRLLGGVAILLSLGLQFSFVFVSECVATAPNSYDCSLFGM